jgi:hypothetical protein
MVSSPLLPSIDLLVTTPRPFTLPNPHPSCRALKVRRIIIFPLIHHANNATAKTNGYIVERYCKESKEGIKSVNVKLTIERERELGTFGWSLGERCGGTPASPQCTAGTRGKLPWQGRQRYNIKAAIT